MNIMNTTLALLLGCSGTLACAAPLPDAVAGPGQTLVATLDAEGAQVYQCQPDANGKLVWTFREPIATLLLDGKTVGRHYAGPVWELADGSQITAKVAGRAPAATPADIPLLRLEVSAQRGQGALAQGHHRAAPGDARRRAGGRVQRAWRVALRTVFGGLQVPAQVRLKEAQGAGSMRLATSEANGRGRSPRLPCGRALARYDAGCASCRRNAPRSTR